MSIKYNSFSIAKVIPLFDLAYYEFLLRAIHQAHYRVWASIFIVNVFRGYDVDQRVRSIVKALSVKKRLGLDMRVILGFSDQNPDIRLTNETSLNYMKSMWIPAKYYHGSKQSTHSKYVLIDDELCIIGSHNWTPSAFGSNKEDSIAVYSRDHNAELSKQFMGSWVD